MLLNGNQPMKIHCSTRWRLCLWGLTVAVTLALSMLTLRPVSVVAKSPSSEKKEESWAGAPETYCFVTLWPKVPKGWDLVHPQGVAVDSSGNVYVADTGNNRIQKFDSSGNFLTKWGSEGAGNGQFKIPYDIAVDSSGNVYVADSGNHRIQKFRPGN